VVKVNAISLMGEQVATPTKANTETPPVISRV
jgi:hypothetical protein